MKWTSYKAQNHKSETSFPLKIKQKQIVTLGTIFSKSFLAIGRKRCQVLISPTGKWMRNGSQPSLRTLCSPLLSTLWKNNISQLGKKWNQFHPTNIYLSPVMCWEPVLGGKNRWVDRIPALSILGPRQSGCGPWSTNTPWYIVRNVDSQVSPRSTESETVC